MHKPNFYAKHQHLIFTCIMVILTIGVIIVFAECGMRLRQWLKNNTWVSTADVRHYDYGDTWRQNGMGPGGFLKENFDAPVIDGYGGLVKWQNNSSGFRSEREFAPVPPPETLRILSIGDSFTLESSRASGMVLGREKSLDGIYKTPNDAQPETSVK